MRNRLKDLQRKRFDKIYSLIIAGFTLTVIEVIIIIIITFLQL